MADRTYILKGDDGLDDHGQPRNRNYNAKRLSDRSLDELIGICKCLVADGKITEEELNFLASWMQANQQFCNSWPANVIAGRIQHILADDIIDQEEREDLFLLLAQTVGERSSELGRNFSTTLPFTHPAPPVFFADHAFCFTGRFCTGCRKNCEEEVRKRGGLAHANVTRDTHYLVIGLIGSRDWIHTTHGRKIEYALHCQKEGAPIAIISEEHWKDHLL